MSVFVMFESPRVKQIYTKAINEGIIYDKDESVVIIVKQYSKSHKGLNIKNVTQVTAAAFVPSAGKVTLLVDDKAYMQDISIITAKLWTNGGSIPSAIIIKQIGRPVRIM